MTHSIYFLLDSNLVVYIGVSKNPEQRIKGHGEKDHTRVRIMGRYPKDLAFRNETRLIRLFKPKYNMQWGDNFKAVRKTFPKGEKKICVSLYIQEKTVKKYGGRTKIAEKILNECEFLTK